MSSNPSPALSTQPPQPPTKTGRGNFRITWWSGAIAAVLFILAPLQAVKDGGTVAHFAHELGGVIGTLLVAFSFGTIAYFVARRSALVCNIVFTCVVGFIAFGSLMLLLSVPTPTHVQQNAPTINGLKSNSNQRPSVTEDRHDSGDRIENRSDGVSMKTPSTSQNVILGVLDDLARERGAAMQPFADATNSWFEAGGGDPKTIRERPLIDARLGLLKEIARTNNEFEVAMSDISNRAMERIKMTNATKEEIAQGERAIQWLADLDRRLVAKRREMLTEMTAILVLLRDNLGTWGYELGSPQLKFTDDGVLTKYNALLKAIDRLAGEEREIRRQLE